MLLALATARFPTRNEIKKHWRVTTRRQRLAGKGVTIFKSFWCIVFFVVATVWVIRVWDLVIIVMRLMVLMFVSWNTFRATRARCSNLNRIINKRLITFQMKRLIGQIGNFHIVRMLKLAIFCEIINNLNIFKGFNPLLRAHFCPLRVITRTELQSRLVLWV